MYYIEMGSIVCGVCGCKDHVPFLRHYDNKYFVDSTVYDLIRCANCNVVFIANMPEVSELAKYYESNYYSYNKNTSLSFKIIQYAAKLKNISVLSGMISLYLRSNLFVFPENHKARILDVGCGDGSDLMIYKNCGYSELTGTEVSTVSKCFDEFNLKIAPNTTDLQLAKNSFDLIRLNHVLEHVQNPREVLVYLNKILADQGTILIGVPNFGSLTARIFRKYFCGLQLPTHLYHYTPQQIESLLSATGFQTTHLSTVGINGFGYSALTLLADKFNLHVTSIYLQAFIIIILFPLSIIFKILGGGYIINIEAKKITQ